VDSKMRPLTCEDMLTIARRKQRQGDEEFLRLMSDIALWSMRNDKRDIPENDTREYRRDRG